jgi:hypothetical protein
MQNVVDITRIIKKYPEALRAGKYVEGLGRFGRLPTALTMTAMTRPDARLINPLAPRVASAASGGMSFTRFDELAMKTSVFMGTAIAAIQLASAVPNLIDAVTNNDGPWHENLLGTTSGRAGMLQLATGSLGMGMFATALRQTSGRSSGLVGRVMEAGKAPIMANPFLTKVGIASGVVLAANELGYFDFFNKHEKRDVPTILRDAARRTPVLSDSSLRTAALLGSAAYVGFKAQRAIASGGLSALGKGPLIGGAIVATLLGAQLLGGLSALDAPPSGS